MIKKGGISLVSQSGGISHLFGFMAMRQGVGMSKIIGLGNRLNVGFADIVGYLIGDSDTRVIALYIEGLDHPRKLLESVKSARAKKPIIAYKTGKGKTGDEASLSHTGSIAGRQEIYEGALRQAGIFWVRSSQALLDMAQALQSCPLPKGPRIAILTGQAGPGMAASDICEAEGLEIARFKKETQSLINKFLPPIALRTNPVDMGPAWYDSAAIEGIMRAVMEDNDIHGILMLMMFASANRDAVRNISDLLLKWNQKKPVITCLASPPGIWDDNITVLENSGAIFNLPTPERAAKISACLWQYKKNYEDPLFT